MGSDVDPPTLLESALTFMQERSLLCCLHFFGSKELHPFFLEKVQDLPLQSRVFYHSCADVISMQDPPIRSVLRKRHSSLCQSFFSLRKGQIGGLISCANTGALVSAAKLFLPSMPRISRPALCAIIPTKQRPIALLDVGANTSLRRGHMLQLALMGAAYQKACGIHSPKVALLNIGQEASKGGALLQRCYQQLRDQEELFSFVGNLEPQGFFQGDGTADVVVTDGVLGNIFLKTAEAVIECVEDILRQEKTVPPIHALARFFTSRAPGALLLGVKKLIIKCHGHTSIAGVLASIEALLEMLDNRLLEKMEAAL